MNPASESLLLLPGLLCDRTVWEDQCAYFGARYACQVPDYGTLDTLSGMAEHVLRHAPPGPFNLAGHSMGGRVALEVLRLAPQRVLRLALLDTGCQALDPGAAGETERAGRMALLRIAREEGMRAMGRAWARGMVHPDRLDSALFDAVLDMIERRTPEIFAAQIHALLARPDALPLLPAIACPTLVLCGRQDSWSPLARHEEMAAVIPGADLAAIEDSGHMSTMEQPEAVNAAFDRWLRTPVRA
ncbi:2-hydroxy-6-oxononadienedioate/2-hydroxy-6-oxononatrienedioate hydrolase [Pigmentiphaga humi]|uniref:2-hydroxy-6-oxononadienedioate/2-hydroxy-6-oxononatrienedioate hydrolase n=1 Tax=Pigmentiphaga humi TaxID=2478468 RepID=A0A3P4B645_9BURK|nr:alpha/beta hydrolase [Pigmentiphaga humi]VCU71769.1 2-hydroxy-6-oxononadienedioate/2-hydroxy-6-oxononatrienedioate hydrolase [Pigmentiphaga humi]